MSFSIVGITAQVNVSVQKIRKEVTLINKNAEKYNKVSRDIPLSLEGGKATYFVSGRGLKKITAKVYGETFRSTFELFYSGEELIFAFRRAEVYDTHVAAKPPPKIASIVETRSYFENGKAIRVIQGGKIIPKSDIRFEEEEYAITEFVFELKALYERDL